MIGKRQHVTNDSVLIHEHIVFRAADRPVDHIDLIGNFIRPEVLERQIAMARFGYDDPFVGAVPADERSGNVGAASDGIEFIRRRSLAANQRTKRQEHHQTLHWQSPMPGMSG